MVLLGLSGEDIGLVGWDCIPGERRPQEGSPLLPLFFWMMIELPGIRLLAGMARTFQAKIPPRIQAGQILPIVLSGEVRSGIMTIGQRRIPVSCHGGVRERKGPS